MAEVKTDKERLVPDILAILPLRGTVLFPQAVMPLGAGRASSVRLIEEAVQAARLVGTVAQRNSSDDAPGRDGLHDVGTVTVIHKALKQADGTLRLVAQGLGRFRIVELVQTEPYLKARIEAVVEDEGDDDVEVQALVRSVTSLFQNVVALSPTLPDELVGVIANVDGPGALADLVAASLPSLPLALKQELLESGSAKERLAKLAAALAKEAEVLQLGSKIQSEVQSEMSKTQREYYLREQMKAIQKELGEQDEGARDTEELRQKIEAAGMPDDVKKEALKELGRLSRMSPMAADYSVTRNYIEWLAILPWAKTSGNEVDILKAKEILDTDHYDLKKVKDRILDYLSVRRLKPTMKGPILCFVGPPGVGKTSLGKSIARALGRKFVRISLGGVHDEAEIRGHRRTYIGALPGQIIQGIRRAETKDPVFMLDEIDKVGRDFRGDPASALLEALDPEQNSAFRDNYLDVTFDLSKVLFITTANMLDPIAEPLRDRMEIIELQGYTEEEKVHIAFQYLVPRQIEENGITPEQIEFPEESISNIIRHYTREAGVRNLERNIGTICRKQARRLAEGKTDKETTQLNTQGLLMEGLRLLDESARDSGGEPEPAAAPVQAAPSAPNPRATREEEEDVLLDG